MTGDHQDSAVMLARHMTTGGDARIVLGTSGLNRYFSAPHPRDVIAFASSTANDVSVDGFAHAARWLAANAPSGAMDPTGYAAALDALRVRLRAAYGVSDTTEVVFAPSGTDLEYVALAAMLGRRPGGVHNILLGSDEVGSGCIHSAAGRFFAQETALDLAVQPGEPVLGLASHVTLSDVAVRDADGGARDSARMTAAIALEAEAAIARGEAVLVHVVHGSKTGLVLPSLDDIDALAARFGDAIGFVVDACQARITSAAIAAYLDRGCILFLTGSKFMGGPPFSGFALLPAGTAAAAAPLPADFARIFRRAEWPRDWAGAAALPDSANLGLLLRLDVSLYELERFQALDMIDVAHVIGRFWAAASALAIRIGARMVTPGDPASDALGGADQTLAMRTLVTLDLSATPGAPDFDEATRLHRALLRHGIRLGQPVRCVRLPDGRWGATLRIGLSMPQVVALAALGETERGRRLDADMDAIGTALIAELV